ncbi:MAG: cupin domain-containing protein, partial [Alphaproteobacteria bacterium]
MSTLPERAAGTLRRQIVGPDAGLVVQRLSTDAMPARHRYAFWKEAVCDLFVGIDCNRSADDPFHGTAVRRSMAWAPEETASFIEVESVAQTAARMPRHIRRAADAWIMLVVQTAGPAVLRQDGRVAALRPGDMVLFDSTRPYDFAFDGPFRQIVMKIPHHRIATRLPPPSLWLGRPLRASSPLGKVLAAHVAVMSSEIEAIDPTVRSGLVDRTIDLVAFTFAGLQSDLGDAAST